MPENLKHVENSNARRGRNGTFVGGYVKDSIAQFIKAEAKKNHQTVSHFLNAHFQKIMNEQPKNGSKK